MKYPTRLSDAVHILAFIALYPDCDLTSNKLADFAKRIWKCTARYCSMSWCYPTSSLSIAPRLTKQRETAWS